jgi:hypothetical protein
VGSFFSRLPFVNQFWAIGAAPSRDSTMAMTLKAAAESVGVNKSSILQAQIDALEQVAELLRQQRTRRILDRAISQAPNEVAGPSEFRTHGDLWGSFSARYPFSTREPPLIVPVHVIDFEMQNRHELKEEFLNLLP